MREYSSELFSDGPVQEFTDIAVTDPVELAKLAKKSHRPRRLPLWLKWTLGIAALAAALTAGALLGRFIL
jgi:hypothetical protein